jgi:tripartite-type tricarboxylate transporter receptor subunit TctC
VARIVKSPETRERFASLGADAESTTPDAFRKYLRADVEKWAKVVKAAGVSAE